MATDTLDRPQTGLKPAAEMAEGLTLSYPGASDEYVVARKTLLAEEIELRRRATRLAEQRRALPPGPVIGDTYKFHDANGAELSLAELFGEHDTLVTYFWMYGPERERPCPMCTNWLGSVNGNANDIKQRVAFKVLGRSPVERQTAFATERGWRDLDFVRIGEDWAKDRGLITASGDEWASYDVFKKDGDEVRLFWCSGMSMEMADPGQDPRDYPDIGALWSILDLTPAGRGEDWYPKLSY